MSTTSRGPLPTIVVFSPNSPDWRWYAPDTFEKANWIFHTEEPQSFIERMVRKPKLSRICGAFRCIRQAMHGSASAVAAHSQFNTLWTAIVLKLYRSEIPLIAFSFHFSKLPNGPRLALMKWAFSRVQRFTVHSEPERARYANHFNLSIDQFDLVRWGVEPSTVKIDESAPPLDRPYICALGKDGRDYDTLVKAMTLLPGLTLILVAQPYNLSGSQIPQNVIVRFNIPLAQAMNILRHCQFMALPLADEQTSCGHITIVSAMFCGKTIVATRSSGISDYFPQDYDVPKVAAKDVDGWVKALSDVSTDAELRERCGACGFEFAHNYCSHSAAFLASMETFRKAGVAIL